MPRSAPHLRRLRSDFDKLMPRSGGWKAFAECEEKPRVALQTDSSREERRDQALFFRDKTKPGSRISGYADVRFSHQTVHDAEAPIANLDRDLACFRAGKREVERSAQSARLIRLERHRHGAQQRGYCPRP